MRKIWHDDAWNDYLYWQTQDKKTLKKINKLLKDIDRNGYKCTGKPEALSGNLAGFSQGKPAFAGEEDAPASGRMHDLSDGFAFVGFRRGGSGT